MSGVVTISVVIPFYRNEHTLARCLDSVAGQTMRDFEVVMVDDGSPDGSPAIAQDYAGRYATWRIVRQENKGLLRARMTGWQNAMGQYVVPLDADDTLPPNALKTLLRLITDGDAQLAYGAYRRIDGVKNPMLRHRFTGTMSGEEFLRYNLALNTHCGACYCIMRRDAVQAADFDLDSRGLPAEDLFFNVRLSQRLQRVVISNEHVYNYYVNSASLTAQASYSTLDRLQRFFTLLSREVQRQGLTEQVSHLVDALEVDRLAFYVDDYDTAHPWYRHVMSLDCSRCTVKTRLLHTLLRAPRLWKVLRTAYRRMKN